MTQTNLCSNVYSYDSYNNYVLIVLSNLYCNGNTCRRSGASAPPLSMYIDVELQPSDLLQMN